jgi:tRNA G18 (ribose-2'-O)-methylase SpoU
VTFAVPVVQIHDPADPRLGDYRDLRDVQLRRSLEAEHGLFLAEGEKVIRRAAEAGLRPRSFLMAERWLATLADVVQSAPDVPCYVADEALVEAVSGFHVHRGALASFARPTPRSVEAVLAAAGPDAVVVVLEDLADHANVGAIVRSAVAFGAAALLLGPRCADPLYRRSVKVAMGAVFQLPFARFDDWYGAPALLATHGFRTVALTPHPDAEPIDAVPRHGRRALLLGSEGHGLSERWLREADVWARIPTADAVDSLNVAAAAAVALAVVTQGSVGTTTPDPPVLA